MTQLPPNRLVFRRPAGVRLCAVAPPLGIFPALMLASLMLAISMPAVGIVQAAPHTQLESQRRDFKAARQALADDRMAIYRRLAKGLKSYPLYGYLRYDELRKRLDRASDKEVRGFIRVYSDTPLAARMRTAWLWQLADEKRWRELLDAYSGRQPTKLRCLRLQARLALRKGAPPDAGLLEEIRSLWLVGRSQPKQCDPPFEALHKAGGLDRETVWKRIELAMGRGKVSLAKYLKRFLDRRRDRVWVDRWIAVRKHPKDTLSTATWLGDGPVAEQIAVHGLKRLANIDATQAMQLWKTLSRQVRLDAKPRNELENYIAKRTATQARPDAGKWLATLAKPDAESRAWRVRSAVRSYDWQEVLAAYRALTPAQRGTDHWRYWQARALEELGRPANRAVYRDLARRRGYHSFLAADRAGRPYEFQNRPLPVDPKATARVAAKPALVRARELFLTGYVADARREWLSAVRGMSKAQLKAAAKLADGWGWHDRAIFTVARAGDLRDMELRFPLTYQRHVKASAGDFGLDPAWVFGLLRQESAFQVDAHSPAGARGLMQLMPATGRSTARLLRSPLRHLNELLEAGRNIRIGSAYLKKVLDRNNGNQVLATASYNAGPYRVGTWLPDRPLDADVWVENIPYKETRRYVKNVMAFTAIYDWRLGGATRPLKLRMSAVMPDQSKLTKNNNR
jgi:soluble lytic murein transglycosylase